MKNQNPQAKTRQDKAKILVRKLSYKNKLYPHTHIKTIIKVYTVTCTTLFFF